MRNTSLVSEGQRTHKIPYREWTNIAWFSAALGKQEAFAKRCGKIFALNIKVNVWGDI